MAPHIVPAQRKWCDKHAHFAFLFFIFNSDSKLYDIDHMLNNIAYYLLFQLHSVHSIF